MKALEEFNRIFGVAVRLARESLMANVSRIHLKTLSNFGVLQDKNTLSMFYDRHFNDCRHRLLLCGLPPHATCLLSEAGLF